MIKIILGVHISFVILCFASFLVSVGIWRRTSKNKGKVSHSWKFFTVGLLVLSFSEGLDIATPFFKQVFGTINFYTEVTEIMALTFLALSLVKFFRKRLS